MNSKLTQPQVHINTEYDNHMIMYVCSAKYKTVIATSQTWSRNTRWCQYKVFLDF